MTISHILYAKTFSIKGWGQRWTLVGDDISTPIGLLNDISTAVMFLNQATVTVL